MRLTMPTNLPPSKTDTPFNFSPDKDLGDFVHRSVGADGNDPFFHHICNLLGMGMSRQQVGFGQDAFDFRFVLLMQCLLSKF